MTSTSLLRGLLIAALAGTVTGCAADSGNEDDAELDDEVAVDTTEDALKWSDMDVRNGYCGFELKGRGGMWGSAGLRKNQIYLMFRYERPEDRTIHNNAQIRRIFPNGRQDVVNTSDDFRGQAKSNYNMRRAAVKWPTPSLKRGMTYHVTMIFDIPNVRDLTCRQTLRN